MIRNNKQQTMQLNPINKQPANNYWHHEYEYTFSSNKLITDNTESNNFRMKKEI